MAKRKYTNGYKQPKEWLTKEEYNQLINHTDLSTKDDLIIQLLYGCALRVTELCNIRVRDIDFSNATITIWESKRSDDPALVPVPAPVLKRIKQWISDNRLTKMRYLFFTRHSRKISRTQVHRLIKAAGQRAGIEKELTTHVFRRTRAALLLDAGLPLEQVSRLLRHKHITSTMHYLRISIKGLQKAISEIDNQEF